MSINNLMDRHKKIYGYYGLNYIPSVKHKFTPIFVNTLLIAENELIKQLESQTNEGEFGLRSHKLKISKIFENGLMLESNYPISSSIQYLSGFFYIQEFSSQLVSKVIFDDCLENNRLLENISILDMASSPGGKSINTAVLLPNSKIYSVEFKKERIMGIIGNVNRMMIPNMSIINEDATDLDKLSKILKNKKFDYIILDAPCSGNFCNDPSWYIKRTELDFKNRKKLQLKLIDTAYNLLNDNGILVYSTCSMEIEENESVINDILKKFEVLEIKNKDVIKNSYPGIVNFTDFNFSDEILKTRRILASDIFTPFFIAKLKKKINF